MKKQAVIGLCAGDEGKGVVVDWLCSRLPADADNLVVRYSGGHQVSHTVHYKGGKHIFSNFGSGTMRNVPTFWKEQCTISPIALYNEYCVLEDKGIKPTLYIHPNCPVVTPYDVLSNRSNTANVGHGTCGQGFGATLQREQDHYHLQYKDLFFPSVLKIKLWQIRNYYNFDIDDKQMDDFLSCCDFAVVNFEDVTYKFADNVIYEGSQGLLLDQDIGFFPNVTRSSVGSRGIGSCVHEHFLVTRAYQTRHGNGPMTNEDIPHKIWVNPDESNITNDWQGRFRISVLDLDLLEYAMKSDGLSPFTSTLCITCMDHVAGDWQFTYDGDIMKCSNEKEFVTKIKMLLQFDRPVFCFRLKDGEIAVNTYG